MKRHILYLLIAALLLPTFASCGGTKDPADDTTADTSAASNVQTETETDSMEARLTVSDGLTEADFGGRTFAIIGALTISLRTS